MTTLTTPKKGNVPPENWRERFITAMRKYGNVSHAAKRASISRSYAYDERNRDEAFAAEWADALAEAGEGMESEMYRRAFVGVLEPVYGRVAKDTDGEIGKVRKYSDTLAIFMAKGAMPEKYRERTQVEQTGDMTIKVVYADPATHPT